MPIDKSIQNCLNILMGKLISRKELAEELSVSVQTIRRLEKKGLPSIRTAVNVGKSQPRYVLEEVISWMKEHA